MHAGGLFRGFTGSQLLRPVRLLAPLVGSDWDIPATGDFYIQASDGSVALPAAGYDYNRWGNGPGVDELRCPVVVPR